MLRKNVWYAVVLALLLLSGAQSSLAAVGAAATSEANLSFPQDPVYSYDGMSISIVTDPTTRVSTVTFKAIYTDPLNTPPDYIRVCGNLNGTTGCPDMTLDVEAADPALRDGSYINGEQYVHVYTHIEQAGPNGFFWGTGGYHDHRFVARVNNSFDLALPDWGMLLGPWLMSEVPPPSCGTTAVPGGTYSGTVGSPVQFDASYSYYYADYTWDFGDGTTGTGKYPSHVYNAPGTYTVKIIGAVALRCFDYRGQGIPATVTITETVRNTEITVSPPSPTYQDPVNLSYQLMLPTPCYEVTHKISMTGNSIRLDATTSPASPTVFCAQVIDTRTITENLAALATGDYTVDLYVNNVKEGSTSFSVTGQHLAGSFTVPTTVQSDNAGIFSYEAVYTPAEPTRVATWMYRNVSNTTVPGLVADGFCLPDAPLSMTPTKIAISGKLLDPLTQGIVSVSLSTCSGENYDVQTTILPSAIDPCATNPTGAACSGGDDEEDGLDSHDACQKVPSKGRKQPKCHDTDAHSDSDSRPRSGKGSDIFQRHKH